MQRGDGSPTCVLGTVIDITDIRRTEMCARETERRLFDVTRSLPAVVFQLRRDAHGKYSFPYIGGNTQHLLGGGASVLMPDDVIDLRRVCAEDRPKVMKALKHSARSEKPVHLEFRFDTPHGRRWGRAELVPRREMAGGVVWSGTGLMRVSSMRVQTNWSGHVIWPKRLLVPRTISLR